MHAGGEVLVLDHLGIQEAERLLKFDWDFVISLLA